MLPCSKARRCMCTYPQVWTAVYAHGNRGTKQLYESVDSTYEGGYRSRFSSLSMIDGMHLCTYARESPAP